LFRFLFGMPNIFQIVKQLIHFDVLSGLEVQCNLLPPMHGLYYCFGEPRLVVLANLS
jgi:hypothetical protein